VIKPSVYMSGVSFKAGRDRPSFFIPHFIRISFRESVQSEEGYDKNKNLRNGRKGMGGFRRKRGDRLPSVRLACRRRQKRFL
jgi:hypothetical protein